MNFKRNVILITTALLAGRPSWAAGTGAMPWERPLAMIAQSLSGPTVASIAIIAMVVSAMVMVFGGDLPEWGKKLSILGLAISVAVGAASFLTTVFGVSAASL